MSPLETLFWNTLFWALYLPVVIFILLSGAQAHPLAIFVIGTSGSVILTGFLFFQEDVLFDTYTPVTMIVREESVHPEPAVVEVVGPEAPEAKDETMEIEIQTDKPVEDTTEVQSDDAEEVEFVEGEEPEPRMHTDVSLDEFDADDDDTFSKCD